LHKNKATYKYKTISEPMRNKVHIIWHNELDSTNNEASRRISSLANLSVLATFNQTAGRGQRGNTWHAAPGENLTFSMVLKFGPGALPPLRANRQFRISQAASLGLLDFLAEGGISCTVKWPNDIYAGRKKICGMLVENVLAGEYLNASVVGIGLNVNQREFPPSLVNPTSMACLTCLHYDIKELLPRLCEHLRVRFEALQNEDTYLLLAREYTNSLFQLGSVQDYVDCASGALFSGTIVGVTETGRLLLQTQEGNLRDYAFKEVNYII
jgi:BirA family biotin operon repressor/biotin-[acetyl-CoA-carboxylase] ligase